MSQPKPTYEELEQRCYAAEAMLEAIRSGQADTIIGEQGMLVLRLAETEEALRLNRERLSLALEAARAGTWEWNLQTNENYWSEELWPVYGLEPHCCRPSYEAWLQTIHPADRAGAAQAVQTTAANGTELNTEWRVLDRDGTERWLMSRGRPVRDAGGDVVRYIGIVFDITTQKRTEVALRESENTVRAWLNAIQESAFMMDRAGTILAANATTAQRLHRSVEEMVGACIYDLIPPQNTDERRLHVAQVIESGQPVRFEDVRTGRIIDNLIYPVFDQAGQVKHLAILGADITERRQAEVALRESEARYRLLAENMADVIWVLNTNSLRFTYVSPSVERLRGYSVAEVMTQPMEQVMTPDSLAQINAGLPERLQAFLAGDPAAVTRTSEVEQFRKDGSTVWTEVVTTLLRNEAGEIEVLGVSRDISARKQAEKASQLKSELLRLTGEMAHVGGWEFDADTLQGTWTDEVAHIHDLDPGQATHVELGISFYRPESRQKIEQALKEALELARPYDLELEMVSATGQHKWVRTMGLPITEGSRVVKVRGIFQDITERKQAEDELRESRLRLELALKGANAGLWDWYVQTGQTIFNQRWAEVVGYTLEELGPVSIQTWLDLGHPDDLARSDELLQQHFVGKTDFYECEARMRHKNGEWVWVLDRGQVVEWTDSGQPIRMSGTHVDITERKRAEAKLQASTERFNAFFFNAPLQGVLYRFIRNPEGEIIDWEMSDINPMGAASLSQPTEALVGQRASEMFGQEVFGPYLELSRQVAATGQPRLFETHFETNGRDYLASVFMVGADHYANVSVDITQRKRAERELHIALEKYRVLFETFPLGISVTDAAGNLIEVNRESERLLGLSRQDHVRRSYDGSEWRIVHQDRTPMPPDEYASVRALQEKRLVENVEMGIVKGDNEITWINVTAAPIPLEGYGVVIAYGDITQRKRTEEALRESEERYRKLLELAPVAIAVHSNGKIVFINPAGVRLLGAASEEELIGRSVLDIIHPAGLNQVQERKTRLLAGEERLYPVEDVYLKLDGTPINVEVTVTPLLYQGKPAFQAIVTDITERKRAEQSLHWAEQRYHSLFEEAPMMYVITRNQGGIPIIADCNRSFLYALGYTTAEVIDRPLADFYAPQSRTELLEGGGYQRALAGRFADEERQLLTRESRLIETLLKALPETDREGNVIGTRAMFVDITERKRAAEALRENEAFIKAILDNLPIGVAVNSVDPAVIFNYMNDNFPKFYRTTRENLADPDGFWEAIYEEPKFREEMKQKVLADCASGDKERMIWVDVPITRQGADTHFITAKNIPVPGKPLMISTVWDVTERKRAEDELNRLNAELEQRVAQRTAELSDLYNNAPCGYHSLDSNGVYVRINDTELAWLGYTREELNGQVRFPNLMTPASAQTFAEEFLIFKERGWVQDLEFDLMRKDGSILPILLSASAIYDQAGRFLMSRAMIIDHTERKRTEAALRESQAQLVAANKELEAFAYSVSHDLRAPLRGIDGWSLALLEDYGEELDEAARQYLDRVRAEAQRMGRLIDDLLQLSRITRAEMHRSPVDLTALVHTVVARLREEEPERQVEVVIQPGLTASGDTALLEIVLTNLLGNAFKFSSKCAEARVEFGCVPHASPPSPGRRGEGGEVYFVRDNGAGFDMAYASKLFGAFQRMHKTSEFPGTGIGLAIVQRIIHRHSGRVWVEAEVGRGATFYFTLEENPKGLPDL